MRFLAATFIGAAAVLFSASSVANASDHPPDGLVVFVNTSSSSVDVSVDGSSVCSIAPGDQCSTIMAGDYSSEHTVSAVSGGHRWSDKIKVSECHANWFGTKTYTFRDDKVPFECAE